MVIVCIYRKQEILFKLFKDELVSLMDKMSSIGGKLLVVGDFNVWADEIKGKDTVELYDLMNAYGLVQMVEGPTQRNGHTLDHVYANPYQMETDYEIINEQINFTTDHLPIMLKIPTGNVANETQTVSYRRLKDVDMLRFRHDLQTAVNEIDSAQTNFAEHIHLFDQSTRAIVENHAPVISKKLRNKTPMWLDVEYKRNRSLRRKYERNWRKNKTETNRTIYTEQKKV